MKQTIKTMLLKLEAITGEPYNNPAIVVSDDSRLLWPDKVLVGDIEIPVLVLSEFPNDTIIQYGKSSEIFIINLKAADVQH